MSAVEGVPSESAPRDRRALVLAARIDVCAWRLRSGDAVRGFELEQIAKEITWIAPELNPTDRIWIAGRVAWLRAGIELAQETIATKLADLPASRRAVRGYAVLRNDDVGARVRAGV